MEAFRNKSSDRYWGCNWRFDSLPEGFMRCRSRSKVVGNCVYFDLNVFWYWSLLHAIPWLLHCFQDYCIVSMSNVTIAVVLVLVTCVKFRECIVQCVVWMLVINGFMLERLSHFWSKYRFYNLHIHICPCCSDVRLALAFFEDVSQTGIGIFFLFVLRLTLVPSPLLSFRF